MKKHLLILLLTAFSYVALAQNVTVSYNSAAQPDGAFTVCGVAETNSLKISNGNGTAMTGILATLHIPTGGVYVAGSITGATESNISNLNAPIFSVPNIAASNNTTITYQIMYGCGVISYQAGGGETKETVDFAYNGGATQTDVTTPSTYNVIAAALSITNLTNTSYTGNVGSSYTQTATIVNGGLGCTGSAYIKLNNAGGSFSFSNPSIGTISNDTLFLSALEMPGGDGKWCSPESLTVSFTTTILNCNNLNRATYAGWGCGGAGCQTSTPINSNVIINNNTPNLIATIVNPNRNYCFTGENQKQTIRLVNNGLGPATNILINMRTVYPGSFTGLAKYDTTLAWQVRDKNGNILGNVTTFTGLSSITVKGSTCNNLTRYDQLTGRMPVGLILSPNDTLYFDVWQTAPNANCYSCSVDMPWIGIQTQIDYKNQCGVGTYQEVWKGQLSVARIMAFPTLITPTDVTGGQTFNIVASMNYFATYNKPDGSGKTFFAIPLTGTDMQVNGTTATMGSYTWPMFVQNDTLFVGPVTQNISNGNRDVVIPVKAVCGISGAKTINFLMLNQYDSLCSPIQKMSCRTATVNLYCNDPCPKGGATPVNFTLKRITLGLPDNDNNGKPDASGTVDITKIYDHNSVNGDTLQGNWNIKIYPNTEPTDPNVGLPFTNTYIDFELDPLVHGLGNYGTLSALPNATVSIYPVGGGVQTTCTVTPTVVGTKAHYDFSGCKNQWDGGDSMVVVAKYIVNEYNCDRYNSANASGYDVFVTNNQVYSTYASQTTPTTAPLNGSTYTCTHFNDYTQMCRIWLNPYVPQDQQIVGCSNSIIGYMRYYTRGQEGGNIFPYEYRNFYYSDVFKIRIPTGFVYRNNSATYDGSLAIANANVTQIGDTLYFSNLKNFYTPYGGTIVPGDETEQHYIRFSIDATCTATNGTFSGGLNVDGIGNGINTPLTDYNIGSGYVSQSLMGNIYIYKAPQAVLAGGGTVVTNTGTGSWTMQLQNLANDAPAANAYFYISPLNTFTNIVVKEGSTVITPDANGFYQLGDLLASANRNFTITADLGRCSLDSFRIYFGNSCSGTYPTSFTAQPCQQYAWFKAQGFPAALDVTFDRVPSSGTVGLCTPFTLEAVINSNLVGNLDNEVYKVILPPNVSYVAGSVQALYPVGSSYAASAYNPIISPAATGDTLIFSVNSLTGGVGLTGVGDLTKNQVKIKFDAQTTCGYISGSSAKAIVTGVSVCGDPTATVVKTSSGVSLTGANPTTQYQITETGANSVSTCGAAQTYTFTVINTGTTTPPVNDSLTINLSNGLSYVAGSLVGIHNAPSPTAPVINGNLLRWRIPSTVAPGDSMKFTVQLAANSAGCGQNTMDIYATQSIVLSCGGNPCSTPVIVGRLISDTITTICCVDMQVTKTVTPSPVVAGGTAVYTIAVKNNGPGTATNVVVNDVLPAGVTYISNTTTSGTFTAPDWTIPTMAAGQRDTLKITVTGNNATTSPVTVSNTAYVKSINNTTPETNRTNDTSKVNLTISANCVGVNAGIDQVACGNTSATITGTPTTGIFTALGTNPVGATLGSTSAGVASVNFAATANGTYKFIFTDGSCTDTMQVTVKATSTSTTNTTICANQLPYTWNGLTFNAAGTQTAHLTNAVGCDSAATLNLTVSAMPNAGAAQTVTCNVTGVTTMAATGTGTWSAVAGNPGTATITTPTSATSTITNFSVAGIYRFKWTNAAGCSSTTTVTVGSNCCRAGSIAPTLKP